MMPHWTRYGRCGVPDRCWIDDIRVGFVVRMRSGKLRTAILVKRQDTRRGPRVTSVDFPIIHCSWTKRGYTVLSRTDLHQVASGITRAWINVPGNRLLRRVQLDAMCSPPDGWSLAKDGAWRVAGSACCDVVGVVE